MSTSIRNMDIAVIGDMELVSALRLAGLRKTKAIQGERNLCPNLERQSFTNPCSGVSAGIM